MFRYVALVWNDGDSTATLHARHLADRLYGHPLNFQGVLARPGLRVLCADVREGSSEPYRLHRAAGIVLGKLFYRSQVEPGHFRSSAVPLELSEDESLRIAHSRGRRLVERYWGRYVAFLHDEASGSVQVLRDPSGALPCFSAMSAGVCVYFSRMEDVWRLFDRTFSINWKYVAGLLGQSALQTHLTGLNEVTQVLGGERVEHREGRLSHECLWSLVDIAAEASIETREEAVEAVRATTRECVHAWASSYPSMIHLLSGGVDSSIIYACLKDAPGRGHIALLNYYAPGSNSDERAYAQLVAAGGPFELIEQPRDASVSLEVLTQIEKSPMPTDYFFFLDKGRGEANLAARYDARAVVSGYGGDQLYYRSRAALAAADFLDGHRTGVGLFEVALDAARMDRVSVWKVLGQALRSAWFGHRWNVSHERPCPEDSIVRPEVFQEAFSDRTLIHPWLRTPKRVPAGKLFHAYQLTVPAPFYNPLGEQGDPESVTPLFSQPLLELLMRIPTWFLIEGGWDRAIARRAFERDLPQKIVTRQTKGGQEEHAKAILLRDLHIARELLLDGYLVREGLIARETAVRVLTPGPRHLSSGVVAVYDCLAAEAWVRRWCSR
jgi:asparagine synthase (glutamine-hydrolysing)